MKWREALLSAISVFIEMKILIKEKNDKYYLKSVFKIILEDDRFPNNVKI